MRFLMTLCFGVVLGSVLNKNKQAVDTYVVELREEFLRNVAQNRAKNRAAYPSDSN